MNTAARRWTINGDFVTFHSAGVARYAREVTLAIDALIGEGHPRTKDLVIDLVTPREPHDLSLKHIPIRVVPEFRYPRLPQFWVQAQLPRHVPGGLLNFCNLAPVFQRRHIVCIHDLHTFLMPKSYGRGFRIAHRVILPIVGRSACFVTTVSEFSRDQIVKYDVTPRKKIVVTYNGADHAKRWDKARSKIDLGIRPFVFFLGQTQQYKNTELVLRLARQLDAMGLDIYMAGDIDEVSLQVLGHGKPQNLCLLQRISDDDLAAALSSALCFLFPSRIEGFGLPAVEAMIHGCPIVASTSPCIPEICGDAALYADPDDSDAWISRIESLRSDHELRQQMIQNGFMRARNFTWRRVAEIYFDLMMRVDDSETVGISKCQYSGALS